MCAVLIATCAWNADVAGADSEDWQLDDLLARLARSAQRYRELALKFTCEEKIRWSGLHGEGGQEKFGYVFVREEGEGFTDYRTRLRRLNTNKPPRRVDPESYNVPRHLWSPYLWIFTFRRERQALHEYRLLGRDTVEGVPAVKIGFEPIPPYKPDVNDWFGTAWVEPHSAQLLRVESYLVEDYQTLKRMEAHLEGAGVTGALYIVERFTTEFAIIERGMRFPSRVEMRREKYDVSQKLRGGTELPGQPQRWVYDTIPMLQVDQTYRNYRFFGVRAEQRLPPAAERP